MIRVGIGGWSFAPWRETFYPKDVTHAKELAYASRAVNTIEINSTYYSSQRPTTFKRWADETPDGFVFSVKASRFATNRRVLAEAGESVTRFVSSGITELGEKLGPILWQFAPTKKFAADDFGKFLELLPAKMDGKRVRHVVEVRHPSFLAPEFIALLRSFGVPVVFTDHATYPSLADVTGDFVYARLQRGQDTIPTAYPAKELQAWAGRLRVWAEGKTPDDLPHVEVASTPKKSAPRDVFAYVIHEGKIRAPAAAMALIERLDKGGE